MKTTYNLFNEQGAHLDEIRSKSLNSAKRRLVKKWDLKAGCYIQNNTTGEYWKKQR